MDKKPFLGTAAVLAAAVGSAAGWTYQRRRDQRLIEADPEHAVLSEEIRGEERSIRSDDGTVLHAEVYGPADGPAILLSHGWACSRRIWHYQMRDLSGEYRLITYDQRGHAQSDEAEDDNYTFEALAQDLAAVVKACIPEGKPVLMVGHSMGAMSVVAWAEAFPEEARRRLAGVVLANTCISDLSRQAEILLTASALGRVKEAIGGLLLRAPVRMPNGPTPAVFRAVRYVALGPDATPAQVAFCEKMFIDCPSDVRTGLGMALTGLDQEKAVEALHVPTVVVVGENDRVTPPSQGRKLAETLPDAQLLELPGVGHMTPLEAHAEFTDCIRRLGAHVFDDLAQKGPGDGRATD